MVQESLTQKGDAHKETQILRRSVDESLLHQRREATWTFNAVIGHQVVFRYPVTRSRFCL